jgi:metal-sulfur cluster biosynthetic enzyme
MNDVNLITKEQVIEKIKLVEDPDLFLDIWFLGLIYSIEIDEQIVKIEMTFTTPLCPNGPSIIADVKSKVGSISGVEAVEVAVVFVPAWQPSDEVKAMMGFV